MSKYFVMPDNPIFKGKDKKDKGQDMKKPAKKKIFIAGAVLCLLLLGVVFIMGYKSYNRDKLEKVYVTETESGHKLFVGKRPYFVKGVCYIPTPIGRGYDYDIWSDRAQPWLADGKLMKEMGINTVRFYFHSKDAEKGQKVIGALYKNFGIRSAMGHYLNFWDYPPPNYSLAEIRQKITQEVLKMVNDYKDEPGVLFWILGNENNYSFDRDVNPWSSEEIEKIEDPLKKREAKAKIYYKFVNNLAREIKKIDPNHPVVMGNGELASIHIAKDFCPDVDILGGIIYTGRTFGGFFKTVKRNFGKPVCMIEFGCDRYDAYTKREDEDHQALFLRSLWQEIKNNSAGKSGAGNSLGGFIFEWNDEWWKYNEDYPTGWKMHNTESGWANGSYYYDAEAGTNMNEEWWGIVGLSTEGAGAIDKRVPKKAYYILKNQWKKK